MSATAGQAQDERGQAERLGIKPGQVVQEIGYDDDCDEHMRDSISAVQASMRVSGVPPLLHDAICSCVGPDGFVSRAMLMIFGVGLVFCSRLTANADDAGNATAADSTRHQKIV